MKITRVRSGTDIVLAHIDDDTVTPIWTDSQEPWTDPLREWLHAGRPAPQSATVLALNRVELLAPVRSPQKIIGVGLNFRDHAKETGKTLPDAPMLFTKAPSAIIGRGDAISIRAAGESVDYEGELAVVIGSRARSVSADDALNHVLGYTIGNDVSARDAQQADKQFFRAKSFDTFCPLGPYIVTTDEFDDPQSAAIRTYVNDDLRQDGTTADMVFGIAALVSYISQAMTLEPGDIILTGTPAGVGTARTPPLYLRIGDTVRIEIDRIGTLTNPVTV